MRGSAVQVRLVALLANRTLLHPNSRIVGYATVAAVTLGMLLLGWRIFIYTELERDHVWVRFSGTSDLIGSLQDDDPVAIQGVDVGQIEDFLSDTAGVLVRLRFWKHQRIYRDAHASNVGNGLMGMRYILLDPGVDSTHPLDRNATIQGTFNPGIAEVMSQIQLVVEKTNQIRIWLQQQAHGDSGQEPVHRYVNAGIDGTTRILGDLDRVAGKLPALGAAARSGGTLAKNLTDSLHAMEPALVQALGATDSALRQLQATLSTAHAAAKGTQGLVRDVDAQIAPFARDDSLLRRLEQTLTLVDQLEAFTQGRTRMKTNIRLWGSNPSKRGE